MLVGSAATMLAYMRTVPGTSIGDALRSWDLWVVTGAAAGALLGVLLWTLLAPRSRVHRATAILVAANCLAWLSYVVVTPPMPGIELDAIPRQRAADDARWLDGRVNGIHDGPSVLAARESGFWPVNPSHRFLLLMSGPVIGFAELQVVPSRYLGTRPTSGESYWIAGIAFVLSTAWWTTVGGLVAWIRSVWKQRAAARIPLVYEPHGSKNHGPRMTRMTRIPRPQLDADGMLICVSHARSRLRAEARRAKVGPQTRVGPAKTWA
jgi:hypothetical protein